MYLHLLVKEINCLKLCITIPLFSPIFKEVSTWTFSVKKGNSYVFLSPCSLDGTGNLMKIVIFMKWMWRNRNNCNTCSFALVTFETTSFWIRSFFFSVRSLENNIEQGASWSSGDTNRKSEVCYRHSGDMSHLGPSDDMSPSPSRDPSSSGAGTAGHHGLKEEEVMLLQLLDLQDKGMASDVLSCFPRPPPGKSRGKRHVNLYDGRGYGRGRG